MRLIVRSLVLCFCVAFWTISPSISGASEGVFSSSTEFFIQPAKDLYVAVCHLPELIQKFPETVSDELDRCDEAARRFSYTSFPSDRGSPLAAGAYLSSFAAELLYTLGGGAEVEAAWDSAKRGGWNEYYGHCGRACLGLVGLAALSKPATALARSVEVRSPVVLCAAGENGLALGCAVAEVGTASLPTGADLATASAIFMPRTDLAEMKRQLSESLNAVRTSEEKLELLSRLSFDKAVHYMHSIWAKNWLDVERELSNFMNRAASSRIRDGRLAGASVREQLQCFLREPSLNAIEIERLRAIEARIQPLLAEKEVLMREHRLLRKSFMDWDGAARLERAKFPRYLLDANDGIVASPLLLKSQVESFLTRYVR